MASWPQHPENARHVQDRRPPNGAVIVAQSRLGIAAGVRDDGDTLTFQLSDSDGPGKVSIELPAWPRWCVTMQPPNGFSSAPRTAHGAGGRLPTLARRHVQCPLIRRPRLDIDHSRARLDVAWAYLTLVEMSSTSGEIVNVWPIGGPPDVTFFNPATGLVHVAIGEPGLSISLIRATDVAHEPRPARARIPRHWWRRISST